MYHQILAARRQHSVSRTYCMNCKINNFAFMPHPALQPDRRGPGAHCLHVRRNCLQWDSKKLEKTIGYGESSPPPGSTPLLSLEVGSLPHSLFFKEVPCRLARSFLLFSVPRNCCICLCVTVILYITMFIMGSSVSWVLV